MFEYMINHLDFCRWQPVVHSSGGGTKYDATKNSKSLGFPQFPHLLDPEPKDWAQWVPLW